MPSPARPHISAALQHLRYGVTGAGAVLCLALLAHVILWGCVHFMDLRTQRLGPERTAPQSLTVVNKALAAEETPAPRKETRGAGKSLVEGRGGNATPDAARRAAEGQSSASAAVDVNTVPAPAEYTLRRVAAVIQTIGIGAALILALLMFQGVCIAGGAQVPGIEFAVTASMWGFIIALLCMPVEALVPAIQFPGVFASYNAMTSSADAYRADLPSALAAPGYYGLFLILPALTALGVAASVLRFRAGIEEGVVITSVNQLDERIEKEIRTNKWGALSMPRSVGALNRAIGDRPAAPGAPGMMTAGHPGVTARAAGAESMGPAPEEPPPGALRRPI